MEKFDIKTAVSLLPIMNGDEDITKKLINSIELYSSMIDKDGQGILINFILKTRLTENAKLRLSASYSDCGLLVEDMKTHLLTKKSSNAVHAELMNIRQNTSSLENYGKKIEELFVDLTISQADGDQNAYAILKPINEKLAIKRFTDGLRDRNLSTIISARNYGLLKDAIRAAKDEELSSSRSASTEDTVYYSGRGRSAALTAPGGGLCTDIDECRDDVCSHVCHNVPGTFYCSCFTGYANRWDRRGCKATSSHLGVLYVSGNCVRSITRDAHATQLYSTQTRGITGMDYDVR
ncbi:unnamed protein product [Plutella xylostella]|uniref:(diamondback moth) hypothetical protein n=1 Tax=Plutella xylostella TaxID=51655 RepID=A0A8S4F853_PLUXY|nr:unnamed protein product [Plutella xylostella]